jgi:hypothetical protein
MTIHTQDFCTAVWACPEQYALVDQLVSVVVSSSAQYARIKSVT